VEGAGMKTCPRCQIELKEQSFGDLRVDMCPTCEGSWWEDEDDELGQVMRLEDPIKALEGSELAPILVQDKLPPSSLEAPAACPVCSKIMDRYRYLMISEIWLDRCPDHGIWLDDGELSAIVDYFAKSQDMELDPVASARLKEKLREIAARHKPERGFKAWMGSFVARIFGLD
jgi:Zn-finger nucleic acid-binding protein